MRQELGPTIVMIDHHVPLVLGVSDYVYVLSFGQLLAQGEPEEVRAQPGGGRGVHGAGGVGPCLRIVGSAGGLRAARRCCTA